MAKRTEITYVDDLSGEPGAETVRFSLGDATFEIDLAGDNLADYKSMTARFLDHARPVRLAPVQGRVKLAPTGRTEKELNKAIRAWAKREGKEVSEKGRIPHEVIDAYWTANGRKR